jgi:hypothetical protein
VCSSSPRARAQVDPEGHHHYAEHRPASEVADEAVDQHHRQAEVDQRHSDAGERHGHEDLRGTIRFALTLFFRYFTDKEELFFAEDERLLDIIHDTLDHARPASRSSTWPTGRLARWVRDPRQDLQALVDESFEVLGSLRPRQASPEGHSRPLLEGWPMEGWPSPEVGSAAVARFSARARFPVGREPHPEWVMTRAGRGVRVWSDPGLERRGGDP